MQLSNDDHNKFNENLLNVQKVLMHLKRIINGKKQSTLDNQ